MEIKEAELALKNALDSLVRAKAILADAKNSKDDANRQAAKAAACMYGILTVFPSSSEMGQKAISEWVDATRAAATAEVAMVTAKAAMVTANEQKEIAVFRRSIPNYGAGPAA